MAQLLKKHYVYIITIIIYYVVVPVLCKDTDSAMFTLLIILPLVSILISSISAKTIGFKLHLSIIVGLLWLPMAFIFNESAAIYALIYGITSMIGQGIGYLFKKEI